jgi:hypothetical protein
VRGAHRETEAVEVREPGPCLGFKPVACPECWRSGWWRVPVCRCSTPYKTTACYVPGREECRRLEERLRSEAPMPVICYYEDLEWL